MTKTPQKMHDLEIGDVLYASWGYDQTNIQYYEVVKVTPKTVSVLEIDTALAADQGDDHTHDKVVPAKGQYKDPRRSDTAAYAKGPNENYWENEKILKPKVCRAEGLFKPKDSYKSVTIRPGYKFARYVKPDSVQYETAWGYGH